MIQESQTEARVEKCVIITGLSGAGKSTALNILEDRGFFAVDNLPPTLLPQLIEVLARNRSAVGVGVAVVVDVRGEVLLEDIYASLESMKSVLDITLLFLDAADDWLVRRYETTRRRHPLGRGVTILESVEKERRRLNILRTKADLVIDSSSLLPNDLRMKILTELGMSDDPQGVIISSFGFKNGIPTDSDYLLDVRFLTNPNYVVELKKLSGKDIEVQNYVARDPRKDRFMEKALSFLDYILSQYRNTGKKQVHIAIGCTGGRHRSVAIAEELASRLSSYGHKIIIKHRDIDKEGQA